MGKLYQKIMSKWGGKVEETKSPVQANVDTNGTALHTIRVDDDVYSVDKTVESAIEQSGAILADEYTTLDTSEMTEQDLARLYQTVINKRAIILAGDTVLYPMYDEGDAIRYSFCFGTGNNVTVYTYKIEYDSTHESVTTITDDTFGVNKIVATNVAIASADWVSDSTYSSEGYVYRAKANISGVTASMFPVVCFSPAQAVSGNYAPVAESTVDGVYVYSKVNSAITIPAIYVM